MLLASQKLSKREKHQAFLERTAIVRIKFANFYVYLKKQNVNAYDVIKVVMQAVTI
jgi:hypothetical protein